MATDPFTNEPLYGPAAILQEGRAAALTRLPFHSAVRAASRGRPGVFWASTAAVTWVSGRRVITWLPATEAFGDEEKRKPGVVQTRRAVAAFTGADLTDLPWTYPSLARYVTGRWLGIDQRPDPVSRALVPRWHYQYCQPCVTPYCAMYDMEAAYWQIAAAVPSPRITYIGERVYYQPLPREHRRRWELLKEAARPYKRLRLALIGVNAVGWQGPGAGHDYTAVCYKDGELLRMPGSPPAHLQPLAMTCVRCTYELTQIEAERMPRVIYSNGDCVTTEDPSAIPEYWSALGIRYTRKAAGPGTINRLADYSIGDVFTEQYALNTRGSAQPTEHDPLPDPWVHLQVLGVGRRLP